MDRRPSTYPVPFHDVYLIELRQDAGDSALTQNMQPSTEQPWIVEVQASLERVEDIGGEAVLLGVW